MANPQPLSNMLPEYLKLQVESKDVKAMHNNSVGNVEVLIQWKDLPDFEAAWESFDAIITFSPWGQGEISGGNIVSKPPISYVYVRSMPKLM